MAETVILSGGYGSGKSEIALNLAYLFRTQAPVSLIDLDLVNPYFAARDMALKLAEDDIRLVAPSGAFAFTDLPSIPGDLPAQLHSAQTAVIDLAGDESGTVVLGYIHPLIAKRPGYEWYLVINPYRPFAETEADMQQLLADLEMAGRMRFTGIISNPNLLEATTAATIREGHRQVEAYSQAFQLPIRYLSVLEPFYPELYPEYGDLLLKMKLFLRPDYLQ